jgi:8-oxo-dGTP pyrophosphatase MutT (NUDIX family)
MSDIEWTTWDGLPISREAPYGASIVVYRKGERGSEFLLLHRAHQGAAYQGDWAWTPPSGSRLPNEPVDECARRELWEETGLTVPIQAIEYGQEGWALYYAEVGADERVTLDAEHDRYEWVTLETALARCLPVVVGECMECVARLLDIGQIRGTPEGKPIRLQNDAP